MPSQGAQSNRGPWIIAGAIVLVGIIVVLVLVLLLKSNGSDSVASPSPSVQTTPPTPSPTAPHTRNPKPSPTTTSSPTPPPSPQPSQEEILRAAVEKKANKDRPNEVKHVGNVQFYRDSGCPSKQAGQANVRYTSPEKAGIYIFCQDGSKWVYSQGPLYGE